MRETILLVLLVIAIGLLLYLYIRNRQLHSQVEMLHDVHREKLKQEFNEKVISLLRNYRHDWLNHMQVILGYVSLRKSDKIAGYITQVHEEARQHTLISKLGPIDLVVFLYMVPVEYPRINLQLELSENLTTVDFEKIGADLLQLLKRIFDYLESYSLDEHQIHALILSMNRLEKQLVVNIEYEGNFEPYYSFMMTVGEKLKQQGGEIFIDLYNEQEFIIEFYFPIQARGVADVC
ncbi:Spo0B domain-containing protein [Tepidibacillus marianensis]|uniref:Spo0B domain-containing protein n=1 Tax=Tepidibacillus marianensis TaxID=3131995 RepID=UPI0030CA888D